MDEMPSRNWANVRTPRSAASLAVCTSLALLSMERPAAAADTQLAWSGFMRVTKSTSQCVTAGGGGVAVGDKHVTVFRPKIRNTDTPTFISILHALSALTLENKSETTRHQMHGTGNYAGTQISGKAKVVTFSGTYTFTISPLSITAATGEIGIVGTINGYSNVAGCSVSFDAFYSPEP
jgi:hypothetical protein